jgi:hypothetical protein
LLRTEAEASALAIEYQTCAATGVGAEVRCVIDPAALLNFASVAAYSELSGVNDEDMLEKYLPSVIEVRYDPSLLDAEEFDQARVTFNLYLPDNDGANKNDDTLASYLIVAKLDGTPLSVVVTTDLDDGPRSTHFAALKLTAPDTIIGMSNTWCSEIGTAYVWKWKEGAEGIFALNAAVVGGSHDISVSYKAPTGDDGVPAAYWLPGTAESTNLDEHDAATGAVLRSFPATQSGYMNHAQIFEKDTRALISYRLANTVAMFDMETGEELWSAGGTGGTLDLINLDGSRIPAGTNSIWYGQHNAEYFGDESVYLFDNAYERETPSRLIKVRVDVEAKTATVEWAHVIFDSYPHGYSDVFGDADRLPSGNVLATWFTGALYPEKGLDFDAQIVQITPDHETAWSMAFKNTQYVLGGAPCVAEGDAGCERSIKTGWKMYSAEMFYEGPRVKNAAVADATLMFSAAAAFKRKEASDATWTLAADEAVLATGAFSFPAYHRAVDAEFALPAAPPAGVPLTLTVSDEFGSTTTVTI